MESRFGGSGSWRIVRVKKWRRRGRFVDSSESAVLLRCLGALRIGLNFRGDRNI